MSTTLTIRLPEAQRAALQRRAAVLKLTESALLRELVARETAQVSPAELAEKWAGAVDSVDTTRPDHPLKQRLRERNWRR